MTDGKILEIPGGAIMPVRPGSIKEEDKARLREIGIVVFEHENPADVQLIAPLAGSFPASHVIDAAIHCLAMFPSDGKAGVSSADHMRSRFVQRLAAICSKAAGHD